MFCFYTAHQFSTIAKQLNKYKKFLESIFCFQGIFFLLNYDFLWSIINVSNSGEMIMRKILFRIICIVICGVMVFFVGASVGKKTTKDNNITFVTAQGKKQWKEPVEKLVVELKKEDDPDMFSASAHAFGLFDVNLDGVPELIRVLPGGSAGNLFFEGYDICSGECIATFGGGRFNEDLNGGWCTYYKIDGKEFVNVGICITRGGSDARFKNISCIEFNEERNSFDDKSILYCSYNMTNDIVDEELVEKDINVSFRVDGEEATLDAYNSKYDYFLKNYIRLDETTMSFVRVSDIESKETEEFSEKMTQALLENSQEYVSFNTEG